MRISTVLILSTCLISLVYCTCDPGRKQCEKNNIGCQTDDCICLPGYRSTFPISAICEPICGDNQVVGNEKCDGGLGCCSCRCLEGFIPTTPVSKDCIKAPTTTTPVCTFRTQTQGGFGSECNGNNNGCFRDQRFAQCFSGGITIGRTECNFATFTTSAAVAAFLPSGGTAAALTTDYTNPTSLDNVLAGQTLTALLNVGFDSCVTDFSSCALQTRDLCFKENACAGFSVGVTIRAAQFILGSCSTTSCTSAGLSSALCSLSPSTISECLAKFNEAFVDGRTTSANKFVGSCTTSATVETSDDTKSSGADLAAGAITIITMISALF